MADRQTRRLAHLRNSARHEPSKAKLRCPLCSKDVAPDIDAFRVHVRADESGHLALTGDTDIVEAFKNLTVHSPTQRLRTTSPKSVAKLTAVSSKNWSISAELDESNASSRISVMSPKKRASPEEEGAITNQPGNQQTQPSTSHSKAKKARSPPSSETPAASTSTIPVRSHRHSGVASDFDRGNAKNPVGRQLWIASDDSMNRIEPAGRGESRSHRTRPRHSTSKRPKFGNLSAVLGPLPTPIVHPDNITTIPGWELLLQFETKVIPPERIGKEVTDIYKAVEMVEKKCIEVVVDPENCIPDGQELTKEQFQSLIRLHEALINQHHDFLLASSTPSATADMRSLPRKYNMPGRMWRYGIHSFLELLRKRLPKSDEHMVTFINIAYGIMTLHYEIVPEFADFWLQCLGDLARYRMCIGGEFAKECEEWKSISRTWYSKLSGRLPESGRMYHNMGILANPDPLCQLYYYSKSLCATEPCLDAWDGILSVFTLILQPDSSHEQFNPYDEHFLRITAILVSEPKCNEPGRTELDRKEIDRKEVEQALARFFGTLDTGIALRNKGWLHRGYYIAISLICSLIGYGASSNPLQQSLQPAVQPAVQDNAKVSLGNPNDVNKNATETKEKFERIRAFVMQTCNIVLRRTSDPNCLPFFHTVLVFLYYVAKHPKAMKLIEDEFPWMRLADLLNDVYPELISAPRMANKSFPRPPAREPLRPLPEDYGMRGLPLSNDYFPEDWFSSQQIEDEAKMLEPPSLGDERRQRVLWLGRRICELGNWLEWNEETCRFTANAKHDRGRV